MVLLTNTCHARQRAAAAQWRRLLTEPYAEGTATAGRCLRRTGRSCLLSPR